MGLGYAGHRICIFEGHSSALAEGLEHAEVLLVDSGMIPWLQEDWISVAQRVMDPSGRVLIHDCASYQLLSAVPNA